MFNIWRKNEANEGLAGHLVMMAQDQDITYKLTKQLADMKPIDEMAEILLEKMVDE